MATVVDLRPAFVWDCDDCGTENFTRAITVEAAPEDIQEMLDDLDVKPWDDGVLVKAPETVECHHCGRTYATCPEEYQE